MDEIKKLEHQLKEIEELIESNIGGDTKYILDLFKKRTAIEKKIDTLIFRDF